MSRSWVMLCCACSISGLVTSVCCVAEAEAADTRAADPHPDSSKGERPEAAAAAAAARRFGAQGATAYEAGNYAEALLQFERAFALLPAPSLGLWAARAYVKLGRLVEAEQRYRQIPGLSTQVGDVAIQRQAQIEASSELPELSELIPKIGVRVAGAAGPVVVTLDERPFESEPGQLTPVDPGHHVLQGTHAEQHVSVDFELAPRERRELVLAFPAPALAVAPATGSDSASEKQRQLQSTNAWRVAGWAAVGAGGAALLTGVITRAVTQSRYDTLREQPGCTRRQCPPEQRDRIDSYNSMRSISLFTTIGGLVLGAAGGAVLVFTARPSEAVSVSLSPTTLALSGRF